MIDDEDEDDDSDSDIVYEKWKAQQMYLLGSFIVWIKNLVRSIIGILPWSGDEQNKYDFGCEGRNPALHYVCVMCMDGRMVSDAGPRSLQH